MEKVTEFVKRMKKIHDEVRAVLRKAQEEMKQQVDRSRKEAEEQKVGDNIILSTKDLVFKEQPAKKLVDQYVDPYIINEVISTNTVKLQLLISMRIHLVVNVSQVV